MAVYRKNEAWWIDTYIKGKRIRRKIGPDKETAELVEKDLKVKAAKGEHLGIMEERKVYFKDFAQKYLEWAQTNKSPTTYARDETTVHKHLIPFFKGKYLASITPRHLEEYKTHRAGKVQPRTVNRELDTLNSLLSRGVEWGDIRVHPGKGVKKLKFQKRPPTYLTTEQLEQLLEVCEDHYLYTFIVLGAYTGMRKGELLRLEWPDVNFNRREIIVRKAKNNDFRAINMNPLVWDALKQHPRHIKSKVVLARPDGEPYQDLRTGFEKALKAAELPRIRIHDLRHSFASNLVASGISLAVVQELMGHKDIQTTMVYAHLGPNLKQAAVDSLVRYSQDMVTEPNGTQQKNRAIHLPGSA